MEKVVRKIKLNEAQSDFVFGSPNRLKKDSWL